MIMKEFKMDLFSEKYNKEEDIYVHCVSEDFVMGKGIAKTFKELFPELKIKDKLIDSCRQDKYKSLLVVPCKKALVANLVTKKYYYSKPTYKSLEESLVDLKDYVSKNNNIKRILMPKIGCGLDRLKWEKVKVIIERIFESLDIVIHVYYI